MKKTLASLIEYPFDPKLLMRKRKAIRRELEGRGNLTEKHIAVLGGSTTHDILDMLELFLLGQGIRPVFYESEYGKYFEDAVFENPVLEALRPDVVFIHTSSRNITDWPRAGDDAAAVQARLDGQYAHFEAVWTALAQRYHCPIIQNNFEYPFFRLMGNRDAFDPRGRVHFVSQLNMRLYDYAQSHDNFFINDINYQSADYGLREWSDPFYWHMYKYALCLDAIPTLAFNTANIIKSLFGKNKKAFALDLDNTLWGGIVGDDGVEGIEIGQDTSMGQVYAEFQGYLKALKEQGILLNIVSKNEQENAMAGLHHPQMVLKPDDFISIKANWEPKSINLVQMAQELTLLPESFVFVDDNPAEREIVRQQVPGAAVPELDKVEHYITAIDRAGYFETTAFSADDLKRSDMYKENVRRAELQSSFADYSEYLRSLDMSAEIRPFAPVYMARIAQLTNKSNQYNLTTCRCTQEEVEAMAADSGYITLYGKLTDCFGDNGVVAVTAGQINGDACDIILWLMSCRVLKRDMEYAMMDELARLCRERGVKTLRGYYYPTAKNGMVRDFYEKQGFIRQSEEPDGSSVWTRAVEGYENQNHVIRVNE